MLSSGGTAGFPTGIQRPSWFTRAARTKYPRLGKAHRHLFLTVLRLGNPRSRCQQTRCAARASSVQTRPFPLHPHTVQGQGALCGASRQGTNRLHEGLTHGLPASPQPRLQGHHLGRLLSGDIVRPQHQLTLLRKPPISFAVYFCQRLILSDLPRTGSKWYFSPGFNYNN